MNSLYICVKLSIMFKRSVRLHGGSVEHKHRNRYIRPALAVAVVLVHPQVKVQAAKLMMNFMKFSEYVHLYKQKLLTTFRQIEFIQNQFRSRYLAHAAKMETLLKCWHSTISRLQVESQQKKDKPTQYLLINFYKIPESVKMACLEMYLFKCMHLHSFAFYQWRYLYPKEATYQKDQVEELMEIFRDLLFAPSIMLRHEIPESIKELTYCPNNFSTNYPYLYHEDRSYNINSFEQIGMVDPLENEKGDSLFFPPEQPGDLVYSKERYVPEDSP